MLFSILPNEFLDRYLNNSSICYKYLDNKFDKLEYFINLRRIERERPLYANILVTLIYIPNSNLILYQSVVRVDLCISNIAWESVVVWQIVGRNERSMLVVTTCLTSSRINR